MSAGGALAQVFGRDARSGYRLEQGRGRFRVVGTTVKVPSRCPRDGVTDEKPSRLDRNNIDIATTAGEGGLLGASVTDSASEAAWRPAYGVLAEEARAVDADYRPETVNTDGWAATQGAWKRLFPTITIILCFWHALSENPGSGDESADRVLPAGGPDSLAGLSGPGSSGLRPALTPTAGRGGANATGLPDETAYPGSVC